MITIREASLEDEREFINKLSTTPGSMLLIAECDGHLAGIVDFHAGTRQRAHAGELGMSVAKAWRRQGVATALLTALLRRVKERGFRRVGLEVFEHNVAAIALYEKSGS